MKLGLLRGHSSTTIARDFLTTILFAGLFASPTTAWAEEAVPNSDTASANKIFFEAQKNRLAWDNFTGFTADITIQTDDDLQRGKITANPDFSYDLAIDQSAQKPWVEDKLRSVIGHRKPSGDEAVEVEYAESRGKLETGLHLVSKDGSARFLLFDGKIAEIKRKTPKTWIEITNVKQLQFEDGRLLPEFTTVTYRDPNSGAINRSVTNEFQWVQVGPFHLPSYAYAIETSSDGNRELRKLIFSNHRLTK